MISGCEPARNRPETKLADPGASRGRAPDESFAFAVVGPGCPVGGGKGLISQGEGILIVYTDDHRVPKSQRICPTIAGNLHVKNAPTCSLSLVRVSQIQF